MQLSVQSTSIEKKSFNCLVKVLVTERYFPNLTNFCQKNLICPHPKY